MDLVNLAHSPKCPSTTFRLRWDGITPNREYPKLLACDECDWSAPIDLYGWKRCKRCNRKTPHQRDGAQYCSDACRQAAYRERHM